MSLGNIIVGCLIAFACFIAFVMVGTFGTSSPSTSTVSSSSIQTADRDLIVKTDCYCGESESDVLQLYSAIRNGDRLGAIGMVSRGAAFSISKGDRVRAYGSMGALSRVRLTSGFHLGQRCWMPTGLLE